MPNAGKMLDLIAESPGDRLPAGTGRRVILATAGGLILAAGGSAALLALINQPDWWRGLLAAGVVSTLASAFSLLPLLWGIKRSLNAAVAGYFVAMGVRIMVSLGGCLLAILAGGYPKTSTLLLMAVFYVVVLAAESLVVAAATWTMKPNEPRA